MDLRGKIIQPELVWSGSGFIQNSQLYVDRNGRISPIDSAVGSPEIVRLPKTAILPGMINAHSHAFQNGLRNRVEKPAAVSDFWSWRDQMYALAGDLKTDEDFYAVCKTAFQQMLRAGITSVGEFHYFHHGQEKYSFDRAILRAAKDAGIRLVLLLTLYETAGLKGEHMVPFKMRFVSDSLEEFWANFQSLSTCLDQSLQSLGVAAHSIRAVKLDHIKELFEEAERRDLQFHIHLEEQPQEIQDSLQVFGNTPSELLLSSMPLRNPRFTAVHSTHTNPVELKEWLQRGINVCITPLTEGRLGDGIPKFPSGLDPSNIHICLGTDCNFRICMAEEMRWLLYMQQAKSGKRGLPFGVHPGDCSNYLFNCATVQGARSLGLEHCGTLESGAWADFFCLDLNQPSLTEIEPENLLSAFIFGSASDAVINATCVAGRLHQWMPMLVEIERVRPTVLQLDDAKCQSVEGLTEELMKIESTSGQEGKVAAALGAWLETKGWQVQLQPLSSDSSRLNVLATRKAFEVGQSTGPTILLNSHIDTVPPFISPSWSADRSELRGRGACDAKGVLASMIFAAHQMPDVDIGLLFLVGEETDHIGAKEANALQLSPKLVICGEPTEQKLVTGQKGILKVKLMSTGRPAHSGYPQLGQSAVDPLLDLLKRLKQTIWPVDTALGPTTLNIGIVQGGEAANVVPGKAEAILAFRTVTDPELLIGILHEMVSSWTSITMEILTQNSPLVLDIVEGFETQVVSFNTDLPYLQFESCPQLMLFGPGTITVAHGPKEAVLVRELNQAVEDYVRIVKRFLNS